MTLDIRTLVFLLGVTHVIQFAVLSHQYRVNRSLRGVGWWVLWSGVEVLAFTCMLLRGIPSLQSTAVMAQNGLLILGVMFFYIGILRFYDRKEDRRLLLFIYAAYLAGTSYFLFGQDDLNARGALISVTVALLAFLSAHALLVNKTRSTAASANLLAAVCIAHGGHFAFRLVVQLMVPPNANFFAPTLFNWTALLDAIVVGLLWTFGLILLISQRLNAAMKEAKEEMELVFNTIPDAVAISRLSDGLIVNVNDGFEALSGLRREECVGRTTLAVHAWKNPTDRETVVRQLREQGSCSSYEAVFQRKDGSELSGSMSATVFTLQDMPHVISVIRDVTERKEAEARIQVAQALSDAIIASIPGAFYLLDEHGRYARWNTFQRQAILGKPEEGMAGLSALDTIHPEDRALIQARIANVLQDGKEETVEGRVLLRGGPAFIWMLMTGQRMTIAGRPFLVGIGVDVSARKQAEEALRASLQEKEALLKEVHHRVKNNLQVITSLLRLESSRTSEPGAQRVLKDMQGRVVSMALLHEALYRTGIFGRVDLAKYLKQLADQLFRAHAASSAKRLLTLALSPVEVDIDQAIPCGLIVNELLTNSLKHAFAEGQAGEIRLSLQQDADGAARLQVSDTGAGLPRDFDSRRGKSLGLQLVSDLARQIGGRLEIDSVSGAAFAVIFTPAARHASLKAVTSYPASPASTTRSE